MSKHTNPLLFAKEQMHNKESHTNALHDT